MSRSERLLQWLLTSGAVYFLAVAAAHMLGFKVPVLFVYYNVPSNEYQDKIISFLSFGWSMFLFAISRDPLANRNAVKAILLAGTCAILGLTVINTTTDFQALSPAIRPAVFQGETLGLALYVGALIYCYFIAAKQDDKNPG